MWKKVAVAGVPPSDEGGGFLRSKKTEGEIWAVSDYSSVKAFGFDGSPDKGSQGDRLSPQVCRMKIADGRGRPSLHKANKNQYTPYIKGI